MNRDEIEKKLEEQVSGLTLKDWGKVILVVAVLVAIGTAIVVA